MNSSLQLIAQTDSTKIKTTPTDSIIYTCAMHPEILSYIASKCPKCGMDLVQKKSTSSGHKMNMMMCPMHGMVDMNHKHDEKKKNPMNMMSIGMGAVMVVMMTIMIIVIADR